MRHLMNLRGHAVSPRDVNITPITLDNPMPIRVDTFNGEWDYITYQITGINESIYLKFETNETGRVFLFFSINYYTSKGVLTDYYSPSDLLYDQLTPGQIFGPIEPNDYITFAGDIQEPTPYVVTTWARIYNNSDADRKLIDVDFEALQ